MPKSPSRKMLKALRDAKNDVLSILRDTQKRIISRFNKVIADVESFDRLQSSSEDELDSSSTDDPESSSSDEDSDDDGSGRKREYRPAARFRPSDVAPAGNLPQVFFPPVYQRQNSAQEAQILQHGSSEAGPSSLRLPTFPPAFSNHHGPYPQRYANISGSVPGRPTSPYAPVPSCLANLPKQPSQDEHADFENPSSNQTEALSGESYGPEALVNHSIHELVWTATATVLVSQRQPINRPRSVSDSDEPNSGPSAFGPSVTHPDVSSGNGSPDREEEDHDPRTSVDAHQVDDAHAHSQRSHDASGSPPNPNLFSAGPYDQYPSASQNPGAAPLSPPSPGLSYGTPPPQDNTPVAAPAQNVILPAAALSISISPVTGRKRSRSGAEEEENAGLSDGQDGASSPEGSRIEERPARRRRTSEESEFENLPVRHRLSMAGQSLSSRSPSHASAASVFSSQRSQREIMLVAPGHPPRAYHPALPSPPAVAATPALSPATAVPPIQIPAPAPAPAPVLPYGAPVMGARRSNRIREMQALRRG